MEYESRFDAELYVLSCQQALGFWDAYVATKTPPPLKDFATLDEVKAAFPKSLKGKRAEVNEELFQRFLVERQEAATSESALEAVKAELLAAVGDAEIITVNGRIVATYKSTMANYKAQPAKQVLRRPLLVVGEGE